MNAIEAARHLIEIIEFEETAAEMVVLHPTIVTRGYIFGVDTNDGKASILINEMDWKRAVMEYMMNGKGDDISDELFWIPVIENERIAQKVAGGIYKWTVKLE